MSDIRCIYRDSAPDFPATDQHPDAMRFGPILLLDGTVVFVDAVSEQPPTIAEIMAVTNPAPEPEPSLADRLAAAGITIPELKSALGLA